MEVYRVAVLYCMIVLWSFRRTSRALIMHFFIHLSKTVAGNATGNALDSSRVSLASVFRHVARCAALRTVSYSE